MRKPALLAAAALIALSGCAASPTPEASPTTAAATFPVTVANNGGEVTIGAQPGAIVSLSPTATEMLFAIGAGPQVIAVEIGRAHV